MAAITSGVFYGGALLAQVQFASPEDEDEVAELANLFQINHNLIVVCDGDREAEDSELKSRVKRINEEVKTIKGAHIWITDAKEIENYLSGSVLEKVPDSVFKKAPDLSSLPDPEKYESWSSYTEKNIKGKTVDKVPLAISSTQYMTKEVMEKRFEWRKQMKQIVERIDTRGTEILLAHELPIMPDRIDKTLKKLADLIAAGRFENVEDDGLEIKPTPSATASWRESHKSANAFLNTRGGLLLFGCKERGPRAAASMGLHWLPGGRRSTVKGVPAPLYGQKRNAARPERMSFRRRKSATSKMVA